MRKNLRLKVTGLTIDRMEVPTNADWTEKTQKYYVGTMARLAKKGVENLEDSEKVVSVIEDGEPSLNTMKTYYAVVKTLLGMKMAESPTEAGQAALAVYDKKFNTLFTQLKGQAQGQKTTRAEEERMLTWKEIIDTRDLLLKDPTEIMNATLLSCYTMLPPRRVEDFSGMLWATRKPAYQKMNFCVLNKNKSYFVFGDYKTIKTYGVQTIPCPPSLDRVLRAWRAQNPTDFVFIKRDGSPMDEHRLSAHIIELMERLTGQKAGASIFRHAFITEKRKDDIPLDEKAEWARLMAHDVSTQELYRRV
jgi:hypothetical protein